MENKYEIVFNNEHFTQIRLSYGILVNIYKSEFRDDVGWHIKNKRKDLEKIDDRFYKTKVDITDWDNNKYPKGTLLYKHNSCVYYAIGESLCKHEWHWELKTTGECFSGNTEEFQEMIQIIHTIIEEIY